MNKPISVAVNGAMGRMGMQVLKLLFNDTSFDVAGGIERKGHPSLLSQDNNTMEAKSTSNIVDDPGKINSSIDCFIDFSSPESTMKLIEYAKIKSIATVIGTTGFSQSEMETIHKTANIIPVLLSPNMSVLVNLAFKLVELSAKTLDDAYDAEIFELHHRNKVDAPSGTAIKFGELIAWARDKSFKDTARYARSGNTGARQKGEIGIQTLRGGDVAGEHTVMFIGTGERLEITHRSSSRENLAQGAVRAAKWIVGRPPALYNMFDVLGFSK
ncbi:MAG: 4-hydroxy-tetrahydrodipicolinate reductase [Deltaproteobacteria bacterium]|nr:4-hydroxy-tetrahydrodipicolinate reductase [Deltaproteobacteria bacterium]MCL5791713.1 4-hydroxy-tetrahydrodipicolinate reductase [Deltaproteobacteria bacterium]